MSLALVKSFESTSHKQVSALALGALLAFGGAANANAGGLVPGQCYPKAEAEAVLKQENQFPIMIGARISDNHNANIFTSNASKTLGYNIEGDQPLGTPSNKLCVAAQYKDIHLNGVDHDEIPEWGKRIVTTGNGIDVAKMYRYGARLVMHAQTFTNNADGSENPGKYVVVAASPLDNGADVWSVDAIGRPDGSFSMKNFNFTQYADQLMTPSIASLSGFDLH